VALAWLSDWLDRRIWSGIVAAVATAFRGLGTFDRSLDAEGIDGIFDKGCEELVTAGGVLAWLQAGRTSSYLRALALGLLILAALAFVIGAGAGQVRL